MGSPAAVRAVPVNVVLIEPEIHFNTGNVGRTCVGTGTALHLVGPLGFSLDAKEIRRSGLDYWPKLDLRLHGSFPEFLQTVPSEDDLFFFSAEAPRGFWEARFTPGACLVFGKESTGLPTELRTRYRDRLWSIPRSKDIRSYNLSVCVAVALFEAKRQTRGR